MRRLLTLVLVMAGLATCTQAAGPARGLYTVTLENTGVVALHDVRVVTGDEEATITRGLLAPGAQAGPDVVSVVHANPSVSVMVDGRTISLHPVEGFIPGFNPVLEPGAYVVRLHLVASDQLSIEVRRR